MIDSDPIHLHFAIPATDHLGREDVQGQLCFHAEHIDLHWRLKGNVFTGGPSEMNQIKIPYPAVEEVSLRRRWFRSAELTLRLGDPSLISEIPGVEVGKMTLLIDAKAKVEIGKLNDLIDFRRSIFLLDETTERLASMREE